MSILEEEKAFTPARPKIRDGIPIPPQYLLVGANLLAMTRPHVSITHEGKGRIGVTVRSPGAIVPNHRDHIAAAAPKDAPGEAYFWLTPNTALDLRTMLRGRTLLRLGEVQGPEPLSDLNQDVLDVGHCAGFWTALVPVGDDGDSKAFLFVRALNSPWLLRLDLSPRLADAVSAELAAVLDTLSRDDWAAQIEDLEGAVCRPIRLKKEDQAAPMPVPRPVPPTREIAEALASVTPEKQSLAEAVLARAERTVVRGLRLLRRVLR